MRDSGRPMAKHNPLNKFIALSSNLQKHFLMNENEPTTMTQYQPGSYMLVLII